MEKYATDVEVWNPVKSALRLANHLMKPKQSHTIYSNITPFLYLVCSPVVHVHYYNLGIHAKLA